MKKRIRLVITCLIITMINITSLFSNVVVFAKESNDSYSDSVAEDEKIEKSKVKDSYQSDGSRMLSSPRIVKDSSMTAGQKVTWDCVWFGSYPQSEVEKSAPIYSTLQKASGWDSKNEITVGGNHYRRMKKGDATYAVSGNSAYYNWSDADTYHYFKYEPIKWRVLKINGTRALLLSDLVLDKQKYNIENNTAVTWKTSAIRSWLNGYANYGSKDFINSAFTAGERSAIAETSVINANNINYGTTGGDNTTDKVFFLSESEVYGNSAVPHGFASRKNTQDEARRCESSTYAKAMGTSVSTDNAYKGKCYWWLRSPGVNSTIVANVGNGGYVFDGSYQFNNDGSGVRAALNLNLSSNLWSYAGTVGSKEREVFYQVSYDANEGDKAPASQIKYSGVPLSLSGQKPVRAGYTFLGWSEDRNAKNVFYYAGEKYTKDENIILYAVWKKNESGSANPSTPGISNNVKKQQKITTGADSYTKAYGSNAFSLGARASGGGKLTYSSSNKRIATVSSKGKVTVKAYGTARITIKAAAAGNYKSAVKKITVKVVPKKIELRLVKSPSKKKIKISWKKDKDVTGYEIYVSPRKDFKRETIKRAYKKNVSSKTIIGWKSKKTYYVKIRAYKKAGKTTYYGAWSKVKKVKVK